MSMDNKIFIGNVPHYVSETILRERFAQHGNIRDMFYFRDILGSDRGWATVTYMNAEEAATAQAIEDGAGDPFPGAERPLHVKFSNVPLTSREGTVFDLRPKEQKVLTPWTECVSEENDGAVYYINELTEETTWERPAELDQYVQNPTGANVKGHDLAEINAAMEAQQQGPVSNSAAGSTETGPLGCNLFVHGNLKDVTDEAMCSKFEPFGTVIGCKVHVASDKTGFGYVSYTNPESCIAAIKDLNMRDIFETGGMIKIILKKGEETANPEAAKLVETMLLSGVIEGVTCPEVASGS